jgi:hypothetical protein
MGLDRVDPRAQLNSFRRALHLRQPSRDTIELAEIVTNGNPALIMAKLLYSTYNICVGINNRQFLEGRSP